jgi:uncharacterized membrane-anchored protein YitT (DUF2179 family)
MIALGSAIYAFSVDMVSIPNKLADGGLSGFTLIIRHFLGGQPRSQHLHHQYSLDLFRL